MVVRSNSWLHSSSSTSTNVTYPTFCFESIHLSISINWISTNEKTVKNTCNVLLFVLLRTIPKQLFVVSVFVEREDMWCREDSNHDILCQPTPVNAILGDFTLVTGCPCMGMQIEIYCWDVRTYFLICKWNTYECNLISVYHLVTVQPK